MAKLLIAATALSAAALSVLGWGWAVGRMARSGRRPFPISMAVGLALVVAIGGVLNLARCATPRVLDAVAAAGVVLGVALRPRRGEGPRPEFSWTGIAVAVPVLAVGGFIAARELPPSAYNIHDDLEKYFAYPVKMLATGTLSPNPLGSLGVETLGGQAFLQAFVAAHAPLRYLGAVDGLFCRLLCVALAGFAVAPRRGVLAALVAEAAVIVVNPQMVNTSSVFSGAALMMAAFFVAGIPSGDSSVEPSAAEIGLLYAALAALKPTFCVFAGIHLLALLAFGAAPFRARIRMTLKISGFSALVLAPWLALHLPLYLSAGNPAPVPEIPHAPLSYNVFSTASLVYGATPLHYTAVALAGLAAFAVTVAAARRRGTRTSPAAAAMAAAGLTAALGYLAFVALGPLFGRAAALRYACPLAIAALPVLVRTGDDPLGGRLRSAPLILGLAAVAAFLPSAAARYRQIDRDGDELAYLRAGVTGDAKVSFLQYNLDVFSEAEKSRLADIQALVPAGQPMAVWVMAPFWLDFRRNPIFQTETAGLSMRWAHVPADVHYFLIEYRGYAVRSMGAYQDQLASDGLKERVIAFRALDFLKRMGNRAAASETLYDDGSYALVRSDQF